MLTTILMFIVAIALSAVAGFYSVIGMTSIFAAAFWPIVIMTGILETSKVIVASWLYNNWTKTPWALRSYLTASVVILMIITSMGIFGYLSKAHVEQAAAGKEQQAQLDKITRLITQQEEIIKQANDKIKGVGGQDGAKDAAVQGRIDAANKLIEDAFVQVQPQIDAQQKIIDDARARADERAKALQPQIDDLDKQVANLDAIIKTLIDQKRTTTAGIRQAEQQPQRQELAKKKAAIMRQMDQIRSQSDPAAEAAKQEIARIRANTEAQVKQARDIINTLAGQLNKTVDTEKLQQDFDTQSKRIQAAETELEKLQSEKFKIEAESRKLEVEVGPLKYIAELIYGDDPDTNLLEKAVRGVILTIIFVFDPLAVLMLIAANQGLAEYRKPRRKREDVLDTSADSEPSEKAEAIEISAQPVTSTAMAGKDELVIAMSSLQNEIAQLNDSLSRSRRSDIDDLPQQDVDATQVSQISQIPDQQLELPLDQEEDLIPTRKPVTEDEIPQQGAYIGLTASDIEEKDSDKLEWQIIDKLPEPTVHEPADSEKSGTSKTAADFLQRMKDIHSERLKMYNSKGE